MSYQDSECATSYQAFIDVVKKRRSVRRFEKGKTVTRETLLKIAETGRWAPTGANAQYWDLIVVDDTDVKQKVLDVFLRQSQQLVHNAQGFPALQLTYPVNTGAIIVVLSDPRIK